MFHEQPVVRKHPEYTLAEEMDIIIRLLQLRQSGKLGSSCIIADDGRYGICPAGADRQFAEWYSLWRLEKLVVELEGRGQVEVERKPVGREEAVGWPQTALNTR